MTQSFKDLGYQESVGEIIAGLFPNGFKLEDYNEILTNFFERVHASEEESVKLVDNSVSEINGHEEAISEMCLQRVDQSLLNIKSEGEKKYLVGKNDYKIAQEDFVERYTSVPFTPFDMFAVVASLVKASGAYHHIEAYDDLDCSLDSEHAIPARVLMLTRQARDNYVSIGDRWTKCGASRMPSSGGNEETDIQGLPSEIIELWADLISHWHQPVFDPKGRELEVAPWWRPAIGLLIISDRAARYCGFAQGWELDTSKFGFWADFATAIIEGERTENGGIHTLSLAARDKLSVLPKARTAQLGVTLRSLSHNLSLLPARGAVRATWDWQYKGMDQVNPVKRRAFNLVVVPFPYKISASDFTPSSLNQFDKKNGRFHFDLKEAPVTETDKKIDNVRKLVFEIYEEAQKKVGTVHGIVLPELALKAREFADLADEFNKKSDIELLCCGVREAIPKKLGDIEKSGWVPVSANMCAMASFTMRPSTAENGVTHTRNMHVCSYEKHHRWKLSADQIKDYGISSSLDPAFEWCEDTRTINRRLPFLVMRDRWVATTLICEDLARIDPAQEMVRAIGPNLVISILMDGPQIVNRWSARYATVLADDPGSAVLTVNSLGLVNRSNEVRKLEQGIETGSRAIGLWRDDRGRSVELCLPENHHAICLTLSEHTTSELSLDGRSNQDSSVSLRLANHFPIQINEDKL